MKNITNFIVQMNFTMKKILLLLVLSAFAVPLSAGPVTPDRAAAVAGTFLKRNPASLKLVPNDIPVTKSVSSSAPTYYIYNTEDRPGFVIVAGDDVLSPVIGYSLDGEFNPDRSHGNLTAWLDMWNDIVLELRRSGLKAEARVSEEWAQFERGFVAPTAGSAKLIETALWDQGEPYNRECPYFGGRTVTGCVATATAIVMRYHKWPAKGNGTLPGYTFTDDGGKNRTVRGYTLTNEYDWDKLPLRFTSNTAETSKDAVAALMHDVGVMAKASYGVDGTGAYTSDAAAGLVKYMDYDASLQYLMKEYTPFDDWVRMLKDNIDNFGPIIYDGFDDSPDGGGHCFVVDGYNAAGQFHINWGWSGSGNGYYAVPRFEEFTSGHGAVLGMKPNAGGRYSDILFVDGNGLTGGGMSATVKEFLPGTPFTVDINYIFNLGLYDFSGDVALVQVDRNNEIIRVIDMDTDVLLEPLSGGGFYYDNVRLDRISIGDKLMMAFRSSSDTEWTVMGCNQENGTVGFLRIADEQSLEEVTSLKYSTETSIMVISTKEGASYSVTDKSGTAIVKGVCPSEGSFSIDCSRIAKGTYTLTLEKTFEKKQVTLIMGKL